jgi:hypothetical protein
VRAELYQSDWLIPSIADINFFYFPVFLLDERQAQIAFVHSKNLSGDASHRNT